MTNKILDITGRIAQKDRPDEDQIYTDEEGVEWFKYSCSYKTGTDTSFSFYIWATDNEDAKSRLEAIKQFSKVDGRIYSSVES